MTDRELQKLGRRELLQLLLEQAKESERLRKQVGELEEQLRQTEEGYERLRDRLDSKDAQIHELEDTLHAEREKRETDLENVGSIAEAALRLNGVFDAAQRAADYYLQSIQTLYPLPEGVELPPPPPVWEAAPAQTAPAQAAPVQPAPAQAASSQPVPPPAEEAARTAEEPSKPPAPAAAPPNRARRPFGLKSKQEKGKWTLFVGWQHD
ncbi:hypothetical protein [uncultured Oscillibacter sp.]|uniref:hypothetical protein n=1 Tax=uncultured Oscillibacter sp. TaxID=876091 RepID=UPI00267018F3|nr:hypothetical protein [uncultured Oscillibacter sp.]